MSALIALHGFLGRPTDWDVFKFNQLESVDLFSSIQWHSLGEWAEAFNRSFQSRPQKPILMGYSLGGRLALHALIQRPDLWQAAIVISTHPGLQENEAKKKRFERDQEWARRFQDEEWGRLMHDWNRQAVFSEDQFAFQRKEQDYQRQRLSHFLDKASLGRQDRLHAQIASLQIPLLWLTGERDGLYCDLAKELSFSHPFSRQIVVSSAGHRLPWERPDAFAQTTTNFIKQLSAKVGV